MRAYDAYQLPNLPWLAEVPAHWFMTRNKVFLSESKATVGEKSIDYELLSLTKRGIIVRDISTGKGKFPKDFGTYKIVSPEQIVLLILLLDKATTGFS